MLADPKVVGERLRQVMEVRAMDIAQLEANSGVTAATIRRILKGMTNPQGATLKELARALRVDSAVLRGQAPLSESGPLAPEIKGTVRVAPVEQGTLAPVPDWGDVYAFIRTIERNMDAETARHSKGKQPMSLRQRLHSVAVIQRHLAAARRETTARRAMDRVQQAEKALASFRDADEAPRAGPAPLPLSAARRRPAVDAEDGPDRPAEPMLRVSILPRAGAETSNSPARARGRGKITWSIAGRELHLVESRLEDVKLRSRDDPSLDRDCIERAERSLDHARGRFGNRQNFRPSEVIVMTDLAGIWLERADPATDQARAWQEKQKKSRKRPARSGSGRRRTR